MVFFVFFCSVGMANGSGVEGSLKGYLGIVLELFDWFSIDLKLYYFYYLIFVWYEFYLIIRIILVIYKV